MGLGGSGEGGDSGRGSGFFRGSHERLPSRTAPPRAARRPTTETRVAAPVSLPRRPRQRLQVSAGRAFAGALCAAPLSRGADRPTDCLTDRQTDPQSSGGRAHAGTAPRPARPPRPGPCGSARPLRPGAPSGPGARRSRPRWAGASGGRRCPDPRAGRSRATPAGERGALPARGARRGRPSAMPRGGAVPRRGDSGPGLPRPRLRETC